MMRAYVKSYPAEDIKPVISQQIGNALFLSKDLFAGELSDSDLVFSKALDSLELNDSVLNILGKHNNKKDKICSFMMYACSHRNPYNGFANCADLDVLANKLKMSECQKLQAAAAVDCNYFDMVFNKLVQDNASHTIKEAIAADNFALLRWAAMNQQTYVIDKLINDPQFLPVIADEYYRLMAAKEPVDPLIDICFRNYVFSMLQNALDSEIKQNIIKSPIGSSESMIVGLDFSRCHLLKYVIEHPEQSELMDTFIKMIDEAEPEVLLSIARSNLQGRNEVYAAIAAAGNNAAAQILEERLCGIAAKWKIAPATYKQYMKIFENAVHHTQSTDSMGIFVEAATSLLNDYTMGNSKLKRMFFFHSGRHHTDAVQSCLDSISGAPCTTAADFFQMFEPISKKNKFNFKGSFARRMLFLQEQATIWGVLHEDKASLYQVYDSSGAYDIKRNINSDRVRGVLA